MEEFFDSPLYAGYFFDVETGLYQVRNRYYDPGLSTWINRDPIGYQGGNNLYEYCGDNPTNATDPSGLQQKDDKLPWLIFDNGTAEREVKGLSKTVEDRNGTWNLELWAVKAIMPNLNFFAMPQATYGGKIEVEFKVNPQAKDIQKLKVEKFEILNAVRYRWADVGFLDPTIVPFTLHPDKNDSIARVSTLGDAEAGRPAWMRRVETTNKDMNIDLLFGARSLPGKRWLSGIRITIVVRNTEKGWTIKMDDFQHPIEPRDVGPWFDAAEQPGKK